MSSLLSAVHLLLILLYSFYPSLAAVSTHFDKYRGSALGIAAAGSGVGMWPVHYYRFNITEFV